MIATAAYTKNLTVPLLDPWPTWAGRARRHFASAGSVPDSLRHACPRLAIFGDWDLNQPDEPRLACERTT
jgi:hypothetical protein